MKKSFAGSSPVNFRISPAKTNGLMKEAAPNTIWANT